MRRSIAAALSASLVGASVPAASSAAGQFSAKSALEAARTLIPPQVLTKKGGEYEGHDFWDEHDSLLVQAWHELGPLHARLYSYDAGFEETYISAEFRNAGAAARKGKGEDAALALFDEVVPGVFASKHLFTEQFLTDMLGELSHVENSGIPRRRPNGMNRYGVILDQVGFERAMAGLVDAYIRPLASMLFPETVGRHDADEHYAFTVRYEADGDTELAKHGDASVATLNVCLGRGWQGGKLRFFEYEGSGMYALPGNASAGAGDVEFQPGLAIIHRGQHKHQALRLISGERTNLVVWLMGKYGVVRVAPYKPHEQMSARDRWGARDWNLEL